MSDRRLLERVLGTLGAGVLGAASLSCDSVKYRSAQEDPQHMSRQPGQPEGVVFGAHAPDAGATEPASPFSRIPMDPPPLGTGPIGVSPAAPEPFDPALCPPVLDSERARELFAPLAPCQNGDNVFTNVVCVARPDADAGSGTESCLQERPHDECLLRHYVCGLVTGGDRVLCGPITSAEGDCCYVIAGGCAVGRPFMIDGQARRARLFAGAQWCTPLSPTLASLSAEQRAVLAEAFRQDGASEHASIASFSRFALELLAHAAPPELVEGALAAAQDEARHARLCLGLAAAYAGSPQSPDALRTDDALTAGTGALPVAISLAAEGCVAETVSAQLVAAARDRATDPVVREVLSSMARDEQEHVMLAWRSLAYLVRERGSDELHAAVAKVFEEAHSHVGFGARVEHTLPEAVLADHGYLSIEARRQLATQTLRDVVMPASRVLLGATGARADAASRTV